MAGFGQEDHARPIIHQLVLGAGPLVAVHQQQSGRLPRKSPMVLSKGHLIDPTNKNTGTLEGTITGKSIRMVRTIPDYGQQIWTGTYDPKKKTFVGNLTNPSCSFSANKL